MSSLVHPRYQSAGRRVWAFVFLVSIGAFCAHAQNTIYTVAGGGSVAGPAMGPNADIPAPSAVAKDRSGNIYIADPSAQNVFKVDPSGNLTVFAGIGYPTEHAYDADGLPANQAGLNVPRGVAVDKIGNVYIADTVNYLVREVTKNGIIQRIAGTTKLCPNPTGTVTPCGDGGLAKSSTLNNPVGVATDSAGNVYIADTGDNRVRVVNMQKTGSITVAGVTIQSLSIETIAGNGYTCTDPTPGSCGDNGPGTGAVLNSPQGVAVDALGNVYISDSGDRRVRVVSPGGIITNYAGNGLACNVNIGCGDNGPATLANISNPWQIAVDAAGDLFIADPPENRIREVAASTQIITSVAGNGHPGWSGDGGLPTNAMLNGTRGVTVDTSGNIYIADTGNQRVRSFTVAGTIGSVAGGGNGFDGSVATSAILGGARGVALDPAGNLYLADTYNNRVREVTPSSPPETYGVINTLAGTGIAGFSPNGASGSNSMLNFPVAVVIDSSNNVDFIDNGNFVIRQYNGNPASLNYKRVTTLAGKSGTACNPSTSCGDGGSPTSATFINPTSIALDSLGNIYIADAGANRIRVINETGTPLSVGGVLIQPGTIGTAAGNGTACTNPLSGSCGDTGLATMAQLNMPFGVAVDGAGNIFIADTGDNRVREVVASNGTIIPYAFKGTAGFPPAFPAIALNAPFSTPHYLAVDPHGNLYISGSDFYFVVLRVDAVNHFLVPVAGVPTDPKFFGFDGDGGLATAAHINNAGLAIDGAGHLYIADDSNNAVREVLLTPSATPSVTSLTFPAQNVGTTSPPQSFTLANAGSDDLYLTSTQMSGPFVLKTTTCANNVVPPGAKCTFKVAFSPTSAGGANGSITINDNAYGSPSQTVTLTGTGQTPTH
jgi:Abnormal spindle-like microcephaly-assoc'd, ASPM-SPD-2-Hydin/NHL repeat